MKVIFVDDEPMIIDHLQHLIPWQEHGFQVAATAYDGKTALRLCQLEQPQVMIIDIRMPGMDGLELIRAITSMSLGVKFIIMSAYKDFDYAQQAIELGVSSYLVKHTIDSHKLLTELAKVKAQWESDEKNRRYLRQNLWKQAVTRGAVASETRSELEGQLALLLLQVDMPFTLTRTMGRDAASYLEAYADELSPGTVSHTQWNFVEQFHLQETQALLLLSTKTNSLSAAKIELNEIGMQLQKRFREQGDLTLSIYSTIHTQGISTLPKAYEKVRLAANYTMFCGKEARVWAEDLPLHTGLAEERRMDDLMAGVEQKQWEAVERALDRHFHSISHPYWNVEGFYELIEGLQKILKALYKRAGIADDHLSKQGPGEADKIYHIKELHEYFQKQFHYLLTEAAYAEISPRLAAILQYIQCHYSEDLSIEDVALANGVSSSYVHLMFKRGLGRTFLDYVTERRMLHAKHILHNHENLKMSQVAEKVGYHSSQYFSQVFKKYTGMLPHEFRERKDLL